MRLWLARLLIGIVLLFNLQCAIVFLWTPDYFAPAFGLTNLASIGIIRGFGVLFLMWNVPYAVALINPQKYRISLYEAIAMQTIGLVGETIIFFTLPSAPLVVRNTLLRFITFDGGGLAALLLAAWLCYFDSFLRTASQRLH